MHAMSVKLARSGQFCCLGFLVSPGFLAFWINHCHGHRPLPYGHVAPVDVGTEDIGGRILPVERHRVRNETRAPAGLATITPVDQRQLAVYHLDDDRAQQAVFFDILGERV
jgi:hypothetical protein